MRIWTKLFFLPLLLSFLLIGCQEDNTDTLFTLLNPDQTNIHFSNTLSNSDSLIAVSFEYLFNGSGVAIADFNQDGLSDIFFTANMKSSTLYLNEGNMKFKDITTESGVNTQGKWASGAVVVDINEDGWPDIYVCAGGLSTDESLRSNLLFINQKNNTFTEEAAKWGLDDSGYSINGAFFDYDQDGDLDLYLLTTELDPYNWTDFRPRRLKGEAPNTDRLYRNNGNQTFSNVSIQAGIQIEGYGLGIALCDLNNDQKTDLYIANDFLSNDIIYINNGDGTFTDKIDDYIAHTSRNGMGIDMQDFNNDGHVDIMVLDMLPTSNARQKSMFGFFNYDKFKLGIESGYQPQYARNTLQVNNGNGTFSEVGQLAGVDRTDWSWCSLFADFDNDGWQDLFITNGYRQDITNMDFATFSRQLSSSAIGTEESKRKKMMQKLREMPEIKMPNFMFKNDGTFPFINKTKDWGFDLPTYSNGAAYADLDNDGDLDLVINNIDEKAFVYQNNLNAETAVSENNYLRIRLKGTPNNPNAIGTRIQLIANSMSQYRMVSPYRGYLSTMENVQHFGLGNSTKVDTILITWPDGQQQLATNISTNQLLTISYQPTKVPVITPKMSQQLVSLPSFGIDYLHQEKDFVDFKVQPILPHKHSQNGPGIAVGDVNGDGHEDFFVGGSAGFSGELFLQNKTGGFTKKIPSLDPDLHDMGALFFDADGDQDLDLYVVSGGTNFQKQKSQYQDRLYTNDGTGNFVRSNGLPAIIESGASVVAADFDQDDDLDLFVCGRVRPGAYPTLPKSYLLRNDSKDGTIRFTDISNQLPDNGNLGMVSAALWTDTDNDGRSDLLLAGEFMPLTILKNKKDDRFKKHIVEGSGGWWNSLTAGDFDKDGDLDYVAGNLGYNSRYTASSEAPVCMYAKDFDKNGRIDPVMCHYMEGTNYIAHSRDMLIKQINPMRVRFKSYTDYGNTPFERSFTREELSDALVLKSETFASSYLENLGNGNFDLRPLPNAAQVAPMYGSLTTDLNKDGYLDLMMVGNSYATEIMAGRYDASKGVVLLGDGKGNFNTTTLLESGFFVDKDAKALVQLTTSDHQPLYIASRNRDALRILQGNKNQVAEKLIVLQDNETYATATQKDGQTYRIEFYHGTGYLSQSSRRFSVPDSVEKLEIFTSTGKNRIIKL